MSCRGVHPIYPIDPVRRECACPVPVVYRDEDNAPVCFRCGQQVKAKVAA